MHIDRTAASAGSLAAQRSSYYGHSPIKPPSWTPLVPTYIFVGGFSGASSLLAFAARARKRDALAVPLLYGAAAGTLLSTYCLIADLGRPERFMNMLRVFKPSSPMNMGVYIFSAYSGAALGAAFSEASGILRSVGRACEGLAALSGPAMAVYTGVLLADTAVPTWHEGRRTLPTVFAASSATAAGGWGMLLASPADARMARRFALLGACGAVLASKRFEREVGPILAETLKVRDAKTYRRAATACAVSGALLTLCAKKSRAIGMLAGAMLFAGAFAEKWSVYRAGYISAADAKYTVDLQRQRLTAQGGTPTRLRDPAPNDSISTSQATY